MRDPGAGEEGGERRRGFCAKATLRVSLPCLHALPSKQNECKAGCGGGQKQGRRREGWEERQLSFFATRVHKVGGSHACFFPQRCFSLSNQPGKSWICYILNDP